MPRQLSNMIKVPRRMQLVKKQFGPAWRIELKKTLNIYIHFLIQLYRGTALTLKYIVEFRV